MIIKALERDNDKWKTINEWEVENYEEATYLLIEILSNSAVKYEIGDD